jgi:hypothetical protein
MTIQEQVEEAREQLRRADESTDWHVSVGAIILSIAQLADAIEALNADASHTADVLMLHQERAA